jgi:hypothetical protein
MKLNIGTDSNRAPYPAYGGTLPQYAHRGVFAARYFIADVGAGIITDEGANLIRTNAQERKKLADDIREFRRVDYRQYRETLNYYGNAFQELH